MPNIDLGLILRNAVPSGYGDLVTRPTGRAVRSGVEELLPQNRDEHPVVIDFGAVRCLDISCADEIVGKLLLDHGNGRHFVLTGVTDAHCDAIQQVLERHGMTVVARCRDGSLELLGPLDDDLRRVFGAVQNLDAAPASDVADRLDLTPEVTRPLLDELLMRRLVTQRADQFKALSARDTV